MNDDKNDEALSRVVDTQYAAPLATASENGLVPHAESPAFDAVVAAPHPSPEDGGPCATCAFRPGTEANGTPWTVALARMCVEGVEPFECHEHPRACRGWIAAVNLRAAAGDVGDDEPSVRYRTMMRDAADLMSKCIALAKEADDVALRGDREAGSSPKGCVVNE